MQVSEEIDIRAEVTQLIDDINNVLTGSVSKSVSLMGGEPGKALFRYHYLKYKGEMEEDDEFPGLVQQIAENSVGYTYPSFSNGKAGVNWFFAYLGKSGLLDDEDVAMLTEDNNLLAKKAIEELSNDNYDFLHGAIGICYYLLYQKEETNITFYETIFKLFESLRQKSDDPQVIPNFDMKLIKLVPGEVNMGLAHGLPSVIKFCMQCYKQGVCPVQAKQLAYELINFMIGHTNKDTSKCFFSHTLQLNDENDQLCRLAWCYGDLGVAFIFYQAGVLFKDDRIRDFALKVLLHSTNRRTIESTGADNAFLCHGTSGLAYIYHKMWYYTGDPAFKETRDFWIIKTLELRVHKDGVVGYKYFDILTRTWNNNYELLEGVAGIGLAMLSCITNDFSWDYCLMLND